MYVMAYVMQLNAYLNIIHVLTHMYTYEGI